MSQPAYMTEPWFAMLQRACNGVARSAVARTLGISAPVISQVLNGSGAYGSGAASTRKVAVRVEAAYGSWVCPHLTEQADATHIIDAQRCRSLAHRQPPTGSPRDLAHWQACRACKHYAPTKPPEPRPVVPRSASRCGVRPAVEADLSPPRQEPHTPEVSPS